jgi:lipopolysaccharide transport system ATP-binding protein
MSLPTVRFDKVWKKFRRGERHDSLKDLIPALSRQLFSRNVPKELRQDEFWTVENVSFEVLPGQALGIIGRNGAGKSTTLKLLTKILKPTRGYSSVSGRVGALIEVAAGFHPDLTGRENVYLQGAIMGMRRPDIAARFDEIVDFAGISAFIDTPIKRYSSGMNARLGFSIAAHLNPDVLIIDEVLSVGDMSFQQRCFDRMLDFKRRGVALVLVSHNLQAIARLCEDCCYLDRRIVAMGRTTAVLDAYIRDSLRVLETSSAGLELVRTAFVNADGTDASKAAVAPGTELTLRVTCRTREALDDVTFGVVIRRSTDQLLVYDGNIHRRDVAVTPLDGEFSIDFSFRTHLVRNHYHLTFHVFNNPTQQFLLRTGSVAAIVVDEGTSHGGVANVDLRARVCPDETLVGCAADLEKSWGRH